MITRVQLKFDSAGVEELDSVGSVCNAAVEAPDGEETAPVEGTEEGDSGAAVDGVGAAGVVTGEEGGKVAVTVVVTVTGRAGAAAGIIKA